MEMGKLVKVDLRSGTVKHEPPCISKDSGSANVSTNYHVTEEQPFTNQGFTAVSWRNPHDAVIGRVETESGSRETVCNQVDPEELDGNESFRHAQEDGQEDTDDFTDVR